MDDRAPVNQIPRPGPGSDGRRIPAAIALPIRCECRDGSQSTGRPLPAGEQGLDHGSKSYPEASSRANSFLARHSRRFEHADRQLTKNLNDLRLFEMRYFLVAVSQFGEIFVFMLAKERRSADFVRGP